MSKILFVVSEAPYSAPHTEESHDLILASTAYGHDAMVLFEDDGVLQLLKEQNPPEGRKHAGKRITGFEFFDVEPIYACAQSVSEREYQQELLLPDVKLLQDTEKQSLIQDAELVIRL